jgi:hypothetical protein
MHRHCIRISACIVDCTASDSPVRTNIQPAGPTMNGPVDGVSDDPTVPERGILKTPVRAMLVFASGFVVCQPILYQFLRLINGQPRHFLPSRDWADFLAYVVVLGALAGLVWYYSRGLQRGSLHRWWADAGLSATGLIPMILSDELSTTPWIKSLLATFVAVTVCGVLFGSIARWVSNSINSWRAG